MSKEYIDVIKMLRKALIEITMQEMELCKECQGKILTDNVYYALDTTEGLVED